MPLSNSLQKLLCCTTGMQREDDAEAPARRPLPEPMEAAPDPAQAGRPYRDYVETETDRYWREMVKIGSLPKPDQPELRAGAFPILGKALRRRLCKVPDPALSRYRAHQAVNAVQLHLVESGRLRHPFTLSEDSPDHAEALIQLAAYTSLLAREAPPSRPRGRMSRAEAVTDRILVVLQVAASALAPGCAGRGFGRR